MATLSVVSSLVVMNGLSGVCVACALYRMESVQNQCHIDTILIIERNKGEVVALLG